ncbi:MAG: MBG domain-containing protein [Isosphaeraceae bacterium]|nr:MBG domain-containing protein [Isosphaeraceae bacterium]
MSGGYAVTASTFGPVSPTALFLSNTKAVPTCSGLASASIPYGAPSTTQTGRITAASMLPAGGEVVVTVAGIARSTVIDALGDFSVTLDTSRLSVAGSPHSVQFTFAGDSLFEAASVGSTSVVVTPVGLTIRANDASKVYGEERAFSGLEFTAEGLINDDSAASVSLASAGAEAGAGVAGSPYPIVPSSAVGSGLENHTITYVLRSLTIDKAEQWIDWSDPADIPFGTALGAAQLNAAVSVPGPAAAGATTYLPGIGVVLPIGSSLPLTVEVAETPNYLPASRTVFIDVFSTVDVTPPSTSVTAVDDATSLCTIHWTGLDPNGSGVETIEFFVAIDGDEPVSIGLFPAGNPVGGVHWGSAIYQAILDGSTHSYRFFSVGTDAAGNSESPPPNPSDLVVQAQFAPLGTLRILGITPFQSGFVVRFSEPLDPIDINARPPRVLGRRRHLPTGRDPLPDDASQRIVSPRRTSPLVADLFIRPLWSGPRSQGPGPSGHHAPRGFRGESARRRRFVGPPARIHGRLIGRRRGRRARLPLHQRTLRRQPRWVRRLPECRSQPRRRPHVRRLGRRARRIRRERTRHGDPVPFDLPPIPATTPDFFGGPDLVLSLPRDFEFTPGRVRALPLRLDYTDRRSAILMNADLLVGFDSRRLEVVGVRSGAIGGSLSLRWSVDGGTRHVALGGRLFGERLRLGDSGVIAHLLLRAKPDASGVASLNLLEHGTVQGRTVGTRLNSGRLTLVPAPTNDDDDANDGSIRITLPGRIRPGAKSPPVIIPVGPNAGVTSLDITEPKRRSPTRPARAGLEMIAESASGRRRKHDSIEVALGPERGSGSTAPRTTL